MMSSSFNEGNYLGQLLSVLQTSLPGEVNISVISDPHYFSPSLGSSGEAFDAYLLQDRKMIAESDAILQSALDIVEAQHPDILLIPGDLTKDGEKVSHEAFAAYLADLESTGVKVYVIPGNHDVNNPHAMSYVGDTAVPVETVSPEEFQNIYADFGYGEALYRDPNSLSYIAEASERLWILGIDSCEYDNNLTEGHSETSGSLSAETKAWVIERLQEAKIKGITVIGMMHHNLVEHYSLQADLFPDYVIGDSASLAQDMADAGLGMIFTGHYHANDIVQVTDSGLYEIETGSLVTWPSPVRTVTINGDGSVDISSTSVTEIGYDLGEFDTFEAYATDFLHTGLVQLATYYLISTFGISQEAAAQVAPLFADAMSAHYMGDEEPDATTLGTIQALVDSGDAMKMQLAGVLQSLWTDSVPTADNEATLSFTDFWSDLNTDDLKQILDGQYSLTPLQHYELYGKDMAINFEHTLIGQLDLPGSEITAYDAVTKTAFVIAGNDKMYVVSLADPSNPTLVDTKTLAGNAQSVAVNADGLVAVAVDQEATIAGGMATYHADGVVQFFTWNGATVLEAGQVTVGSLPDSIAFNEDGTMLVTANEGEPNAFYGTEDEMDPSGTISVIEVNAGDLSASVVTTLGFGYWNDKIGLLRNNGVRISGEDDADGIAGNLAEQAIEPEYVTISGNKAYVTLQENNAIAVVDLATKAITDIFSAGLKDWGLGTPEATSYEFSITYPGERPDFDGDGQVDNGEVVAGGLSGIWYNGTETIDGDEYEIFYAITDRGPQAASIGDREGDNPADPDKGKKIFDDPDYPITIYKLGKVDGKVVQLDSTTLKVPDGEGGFRNATGISMLDRNDKPFALTGTDEDGFNVYEEIPKDQFGLDTESVACLTIDGLNSGNPVFAVADEYGPQIAFFDVATGNLIQRIVPSGTAFESASNIGYADIPEYTIESLPAIYSTIQNNRGFEAMAWNSNDGLLYAFIQSPLKADAGAEHAFTRIIAIDPLTGEAKHEYYYMLTGEDGQDKIGDAVYDAGEGVFYVIERDSGTEASSNKTIFRVDLNEATDMLQTTLLTQEGSTRIATYNTSLYRSSEGALADSIQETLAELQSAPEEQESDIIDRDGDSVVLTATGNATPKNSTVDYIDKYAITIEGIENGSGAKYASAGMIDFTLPVLEDGVTLDFTDFANLSLDLTQNTSSWTKAGDYSIVYWSDDAFNRSDIRYTAQVDGADGLLQVKDASGNLLLVETDASGNPVYDGDGNLVLRDGVELLASGVSYTNLASWTVDSTDLQDTLAPILAQELNSGDSNLRILLVPEETTIAARYAGQGDNAGLTPPQMSFSLDSEIELTDPEFVVDVSDVSQPAAVAAIIQTERPSVMLLNEFDYDTEAAQAFLQLLALDDVAGTGTEGIVYDYWYLAPSNTGVPSGFDFNNDGTIGGAEDAYGYGVFEGQYGMLILSQYPILTDEIRTFQNFLWKDMPDANLPDDPATPEVDDWYSAEELAVFRLSSKNHVDVPVQIGDEVVHVIAAHPTPPVFDDPDVQWNYWRNADEVRLIDDYISGETYIYDDNGVYGGLEAGAKFIIAGDMNADPNDGDGTHTDIASLLANAAVDSSNIPVSEGAAAQNIDQADFTGDIAAHTADWSLRADYVLPSENLDVVSTGVVWDAEGDLAELQDKASDHRMVTLDVAPTDEMVYSGDEIVYASKIEVLNIPSLGTDSRFDKSEGLALKEDGTLVVAYDNDFLHVDGRPDNILTEITFTEMLVDTSDKDGGIDPGVRDFFGMRMPDGIDTFQYDGQTFLVFANEGDSRVRPDDVNFEVPKAFDGAFLKIVSELAGGETLVETLTDPLTGAPIYVIVSVETDAEAVEVEKGDEYFLTLKYGWASDTAFYSDETRLYELDDNYDKSDEIGRMKVVNTETDGDPVIAFGGRSFSIMDDNGNIVYDSGDIIEQAAIEAGVYDDGRSDDKGVEPENITIANVNGHMLAYVALERANSVAIFDVTNPYDVRFLELADVKGDTDTGYEEPEGLTTGDGLLIVSNEGETGLAVYEIPEIEPTIIITEVNSKAGGGDFFELYNYGDTAINLDGWGWIDEKVGSAGDFDPADVVRFNGVTIEAGTTLVVINEADEAAFREAWGISGEVEVYAAKGEGLGKSDAVVLLDANEKVVTAFNYGADAMTSVTDGSVIDPATRSDGEAVVDGVHAGQAVGAEAGSTAEPVSAIWDGESTSDPAYTFAESGSNGAWSQPDDGGVGSPGVISGAAYTLQLLHFADAEAGLLASETAPNLAALVDKFEDEYANSITLAGGDNFIPGPFLAAGTDSSVIDELNEANGSSLSPTATVPIGAVDIAIHNAIGVEASAIGNHEFDLGSRVLKDAFASTTTGADFPYISANLDFSDDSDLRSTFVDTTATAGLEEASTLNGKIVPSAVITENGEKIGLVGATTQLLQVISSPSGTVVDDGSTGSDNMELLAAALQPVIDDLISQGVNKIILMSHLQVIANEKSLAGKLSGVDIILAAGSNTRLGDADDEAVAFEGHAATFADTYPLQMSDKDGNTTLIVNTDNEFTYLGRLVVDFDADGHIITSNLAGNISINGAYAATEESVAEAWGVTVDELDTTAFAEGTRGDAVESLVTAVQEVIDVKDTNVYGYSDVYLEGERATVRSEETNLGDLSADANAYAAELALGGAATDDTFIVSLKNGGGIRAQIGTISAPDPVDGTVDKLPPTDGSVSQLDVENSLRFNNQLMMFDTTVEGLKTILEHGVAAGTLQGRFPQIGGVAFSWDPDFPAGSRVSDIALVGDDYHINLYNDGELLDDVPDTISLVTLSFLANGGDGYPMKANGSNFRYITVEADGSYTLSAAVSESLDFTVSANVPGGATVLGEQAAFETYMETFHATEATAYDQADTSASEDLRIQNLNEREEAVLNPDTGREIENVTVSEDGTLDYRVLADAFTDTDENDSLTYTVTLADGSALPSWLTFSASHHDKETMLDYFLPNGNPATATGSGPATDSASAGTAMATGQKTVDGNIAWERTDSAGGELETIAETLRGEFGYAIGVASTVAFSHATPATFVSHDVSRNNYWDISDEILFDVQPEVVIGGGYNSSYFAKAVKSVGNVDRDLDDNGYNDEYDAFVNDTDGTEYVFVQRATGEDGGNTLAEAAAGVSLADGEKLFGLYGTSGGNFEYYNLSDTPGTVSITRSTGDSTPTVDEDPTLAEVTNASLSVLNQDADGFFIMIEQGDIDWSNHSNYYEDMVGGVYDLEMAVTEAETYIESGVYGINWSNTLVIVTSDHSNSYLRAQEELGLGDLPTQSGKSYPDGDVTYGTGGHSNELVTVSARGAGATYFGELAGDIYAGTEIVDNTQIYDTMMNAARNAGAEHIILFIGDGMNVEHEIAGSRYLYGEDFGLTWQDWGTLEDGWTGYATTWDVTAYNQYATAAGAATYTEATFDPLIGYNPELGGDTPYPVAMTFSGTPDNEDVGTIEIKVTATDENGSSVSQNFELTVENVNDAPEVGREIEDVEVSEDGTLDYRILADAFTDADAGDSLIYTATLADGSALPEWLKFSASHHDKETMDAYFLTGGSAAKATDSASAITAMVTGEKTDAGNLSWATGDPANGELTTIAETLRADYGFAIGVASTVEFSHATPAGVVSHNVNRGNTWAISHEILTETKPEVVIGAGLDSYFSKAGVSKTPTSTDSDADNNGFNDEYDAFHNGTVTAYTENVEFVEREAGVDGGDALAEAAANVDLSTGERLFGLFGTSGGNFEYYNVEDTPGTVSITRSTGDGTPAIDEDPTMAEMANAALSVLNQDADGFFVMFEQGDIDWSNHANDYEAMIGGVYDLDLAVTEVESFVDLGANGIDWSNTLVIVTSDHSNSYMRNESVLGVGDLGEVGTDVTYSSTGHTNELVTVTARGAGATYFGELAGQIYDGTEIIDNTQIYTAMLNAAENAGAEHIILMIGDGMNVEHEIAASRYLYGEDLGLTWQDWGTLEDGWTGYATTWDVSSYNTYASAAGVASYNEATYDSLIGYNSELGGDTPYPVAMTFSGTPDNEDVGPIEIKVTATDENGVSVSQNFELTVDKAPEMVSVNPEEGASDIVVMQDILITFDEEIVAGEGTISLWKDAVGGTLVEQFDVNDRDAVTVAGTQLRLDPTEMLDYDSHYVVSIGEGSVEDQLGGSNTAASIGFDTREAHEDALANDFGGSITFWKTGEALDQVTATVAPAGDSLIEFRNLQVAEDGTRTVEIWKTAEGSVESVDVELVLQDGATAHWSNAAGLPAGWSCIGNSEAATGHFLIGGFGEESLGTAISAGEVQLGTLSVEPEINTGLFQLAVIDGEVDGTELASFAITTSTDDGMFEVRDLSEGDFDLNFTKSADSTSNALQASDALAALKLAVGMNPNTDGSEVLSYQYLAADVNQDGKVRASDALAILKMAVGISSAPEKGWLFVPEYVGEETMGRTSVHWGDYFSDLSIAQDTELDLIGVVKGDVNGSWTAAEAV